MQCKDIKKTSIPLQNNPKLKVSMIRAQYNKSKVWQIYSVVDATIKRRHLFARYSIVFHSFSVSEREKRGKHIEKR
jgi:hypothetical protein